MGNHPSLLTKTPQEHVKDKIYFRMAKRHAHPPPGHVRVKFYSSYTDICNEGEHVLQGDFPLEPSGDLDMRRIIYAWGLENCWAIDPTRFTLFQPKDATRLSGVAVRVLSENQGCLKVIEHSPSRSTVRTRALRHFMLAALALMMLWSQIVRSWCRWIIVTRTRSRSCKHWRTVLSDRRLVYQQSMLLLESYTPIPKWYRAVRWKYGQLRRSLRDAASYFDQTRPNFYLLTVVFFLLITTGFGSL